MGPQCADGIEISCTTEIFASKQNKQRCRINAAVVAGKGHLAEARHLAVAHFMQDLAGLGIPFGINLRCLGRGKKPKDPSRDRRIDPQGEQSCQKSVAPKWSAKPGYPGKRVR